MNGCKLAVGNLTNKNKPCIFFKELIEVGEYMIHVWLEKTVELGRLESELKKALAETPLKGLPILSIYALVTLSCASPILASELAGKVGSLATSFTPVLDRLEKLKFIRRVASLSDRRAVEIHITDAGIKQALIAQAKIEETEKAFVRGKK